MHASWAQAEDEKPAAASAQLPRVVTNILQPVNAQKGDELPVCAFAGYEDGVIDMGLTAYEKRGIAVSVPQWDEEACIQCNLCSYVCPHSCIRPMVMDANEVVEAPKGTRMHDMRGKGCGTEAEDR